MYPAILKVLVKCQPGVLKVIVSVSVLPLESVAVTVTTFPVVGCLERNSRRPIRCPGRGPAGIVRRVAPCYFAYAPRRCGSGSADIDRSGRSIIRAIAGRISYCK